MRARLPAPHRRQPPLLHEKKDLCFLGAHPLCPTLTDSDRQIHHTRKPSSEQRGSISDCVMTLKQLLRWARFVARKGVTRNVTRVFHTTSNKEINGEFKRGWKDNIKYTEWGARMWRISHSSQRNTVTSSRPTLYPREINYKYVSWLRMRY
jgi:hypothetical protein